tara:strand:- start:281 stop:511 length:231 start_codon:yes stop_codon:yes gene_type:complete
MSSDLLKICGVWKNKDKNGNEYFSGNYTYGTKLLIMHNSYKEKNSDPDYIVYLAPKKSKREEDSDGQADIETDVPF